MQAEVSAGDFDADNEVIYGRHLTGEALVVVSWPAISPAEYGVGSD